MDWNILITHPQREFAVAGRLVGLGITVYLPTYKQTIRRGRDRRRITVDRPLFPGYMFLMAKNDARKAVRCADGARGYLMAGEGLAALSEAAIAIVRQVEEDAMAEFNRGTSRTRPFSIGDRVRIKRPDHPAHMMEGVLKRLDKSDRATIEVLMPLRAVAVDTSVTWLELASAG